MRNPGESGECFAGNRFVAFCYRCRRRRRRGDTDVSFLILSFGTLVIYATKGDTISCGNLQCGEL